MSKLTDYLQEEGVLVLDGAMGTQLFFAGWCLGRARRCGTSPNPRACSVHRAYVTAGSHLI